jgi:hypothetical protein
LQSIETRLRPRPTTPPSTNEAEAWRGRTWVTRRGMAVDRIASAWLIRRFIDPDAAFSFVDGHDYAPRPGEVRFDMYDAEFTHEGDSCTFEVLRDRFALAERALQQLGEIVHDLDLKDGKYGRPEAAGIGLLVAGIVARHRDDDQRLAEGSAAFESIYQSLRRQR